MTPIQSLKILREQLSQRKTANLSIGFVPTLGALHEGHMSLIKQANEQCDVTVCSIFLNPTQFDEKSDFDKYPKPLEKDLQLLQENDCTICFTPSIAEVYPQGQFLDKPYELGRVEHILEGSTRPGHYQGVAQVVHRLLEMVSPDVLFLGQKDFQQVKIIEQMIQQEQLAVRVQMCPIIREEDGLAMSSRNVRLTEKERAIANELFLTLQKCKEHHHRFTVKELQQWAVASLNANPLIEVDYIEFFDAETFVPVHTINKNSTVVVLGAIFLGSIRLIDNVII